MHKAKVNKRQLCSHTCKSTKAQSTKIVNLQKKGIPLEA